MKNIIFLGDLHENNDPLFIKGSDRLLDWISNELDGKNSVLISSGDIIDSADIKYERTLKNLGKKLSTLFKETHIITGNHEENNTGGRENILHVLSFINNIKTYFDPSILEIENVKIAMLPYLKAGRMKEYETMKFDCDFGISHAGHKNLSDIEYISDNELLDLFQTGIKTLFMGHIHKPEIINPNLICLGIPQTHRKGEENWIKSIWYYNLESKELKQLILPVFYTIETIEYGTLPENKDYKYIVKNVPNKKLLLDMYKDYTIHSFELSKPITENVIHEDKVSNDLDLKSKWIQFASINDISTEVKNSILEDLNILI